MNTPKINIMHLLEYLNEIIDTASKIPMSGKIVVSRKEIETTVNEIVNCLPEEIKRAQWILEEKDKILEEAKREAASIRTYAGHEAEVIKKQGLEEIKKQIDNHSITREAEIKAEAIIASAQKDAKELRLGARQYADSLLCDLEKNISGLGSEMFMKIKNDVGQAIGEIDKDINENLYTIRENIKELRNLK